MNAFEKAKAENLVAFVSGKLGGRVKQYTEAELRAAFEQAQAGDNVDAEDLEFVHGQYINETVDAYWRGWKECAGRLGVFNGDKK